MKIYHTISFTSAKQPFLVLFQYIGCMVVVLFLFSCSSIPHTQQEIPREEERALQLHYSLVFIIHGDGDYLYHDPRGNAHRADEEALIGATRVAVRNPQAEMFIFHERHRRHTLLFFPRRDGKIYYYRNGKLLAKESYWRDQGRSRFDSEVELYCKYRQKFGSPFHGEEQPEVVKLFLYFGHEIPEFGGLGYDASCRKRTFTVDDLADGLNGLIRDSTKFDLIVLSTCFGGTPHTIAMFAPFARYIIASPENLHLSYFDLHPFERLDLVLQEGDMSAFAANYARQTFERLSEDIQTSITVVSYDVEIVQGYLNVVGSVYDHTLGTVKQQPLESVEHCDCAEQPDYVVPGMSEGVDIFYRPPNFGRSKHKQNHSGWECWRVKESRATVSH